MVISYLLVTLDDVSWFVRKDAYAEPDSETAASFDELAVDGVQIREYEDVLQRGHFAFPTERVQELIALVKTGLYLNPTDSGEYFTDKDDKVFYEVALSHEEGYVVTGNTKHFPKSPIVVTP